MVQLQKKLDKKVIFDLNCDLGQSFGVYKNEQELELLDYVSSVNISCGVHAGDALTIMRMLKEASERNLAIGAHIGFPDIQGFGYRNMNLDEEEIQALVIYQIGALNSLAKLYNLAIEHVRPHGAMYVMAAKDPKFALSITKAIAKYDPWLIYVGAAGENTRNAAIEANIRVAEEVLLDKKYTMEGNINFEEGDIVDMEYSTALLDAVIKDGSVINTNQGKTKTDTKTIHLAMKSAYSLELAQKALVLCTKPTPIAGTFVAEDGWL